VLWSRTIDSIVSRKRRVAMRTRLEFAISLDLNLAIPLSATVICVHFPDVLLSLLHDMV
jgi:hypothetical protein